MTYALNNENAEKESCVFDQHSNLYTTLYLLTCNFHCISKIVYLFVLIHQHKHQQHVLNTRLSIRCFLSSSPPLLLLSSPLLIGYENSLAAEENPVKAISL